MNVAPSFEASKALKYLLVTSKDVNEAEGILQEKIPDWHKRSDFAKMEFLKSNFRFDLAGRFTLETNPDEIAKEDYFATLQYLILEARDFGIKSVIKN